MNRREFAKSALLLGVAAQIPLGADARAATGTAPAKGPVDVDPATPQIAFAAAEIRRAAEGREGMPAVEFAIDPALEAQAYRIERGAGKIRVTGGDANGAMYGGLDLAEAMRLGILVELKAGEHRPYIERRGIKFNITPDRRTPSYSDSSDSAQHNIPEMWSIDFWHEYLDEMARHRYNVLTLWNLHPFPSIVKVPEYPDVALNDVWGQKAGSVDYQFNMNSNAQGRPFNLGNVEVIKKMTIDEKIQFWREVMQYARDRGIDVYWFTWNIYVWGTEGKYDLTEDGNNAKTIAYFRASVREMVKTYPLLAGIGITAGENMNSGRGGAFDHEAWLWQTYGEGIRDTLKEQPDRKFRLVHRFHQTGQKNILTAFKDFPATFDFSFKYSVAHMYSTAKPNFIHSLLELMLPSMRTWLTVRNDDIFSFRWGDPDYARQYVSNIPGSDRVAGFYMGPDGYCWGREFIDREPETPRQLVMKKQWYSFMLWGRLSFDPTLPNTLFERTLAVRFPEVPAGKLYEAIARSSRIIPQVTRFFWGDIDIRWFPEACVQSSGYYTVRQFVEGVSMPDAGVLNIRQWRARVAKGAAMEGMTPLQVADALQTEAAKAWDLAKELRVQQGTNKELRLMLGDCEAMACLGRYYAEKILGACELALFDQSGKPDDQARAVKHLEGALDQWRQYAALATGQYLPQKLGRVGAVDLNKLTANVEGDIALARNWVSGSVRGDGEPGRRADENFQP